MDEKDLHELLVVTTEAANDIKWLKRSIEENAQANTRQQDAIIAHLLKLNSQVSNNKQGLAIQRWISRGIGLAIMAITSVVLHLIGVY